MASILQRAAKSPIDMRHLHALRLPLIMELAKQLGSNPKAVIKIESRWSCTMEDGLSILSDSYLLIGAGWFHLAFLLLGWQGIRQLDKKDIQPPVVCVFPLKGFPSRAREDRAKFPP
jgi:hypothetical protein